MIDGPAAGLERAIETRAARLAEDERRIGREQAERIARESAEALSRLEAREHELAENAATREYRRIVQAEELRLHSSLDRLRGGIVESVLDAARVRLAELSGDPEVARKSLVDLLGDAMASLGEGALVAHLSDADWIRFAPKWSAIVDAVGGDWEGCEVSLSDETCPCIGGVRVTTASADVRVDNTYEGRLERLDGDLRRCVHSILFRTTASMESGFHG